jgi:hypothetical protein
MEMVIAWSDCRKICPDSEEKPKETIRTADRSVFFRVRCLRNAISIVSSSANDAGKLDIGHCVTY